MLRPEQRAVLHDLLDLDDDGPDYWPLIETALETLRQATSGKGKERHARGRDFIEQPILAIPRLLGGDAGLGGLLYQAMKKTEESLGMDAPRQIAELRGAVIYLLAAIMLRREKIETHTTITT